MLIPSPNVDVRRAARSLYFQGWGVSAIAEHLGQKRPTVEAWKQRDAWDDASPMERVEDQLEARMCQLIAKEQKTGGDFKEIDLLGRQVERLARVRRYQQPGGHEGDLNPEVANRNAGPKKKARRNEVNDEQRQQLLARFNESLFDYQRTWRDAGGQRTRAILKSRQIGATFYFAREAFVDAVETGRNQIFLSASKAQAHVFKQYIVQFAREAADVDLTGDPIVLGNGAHLYFLGTNARTAQGFHGNFYFDEFFWTHGFRSLNKVASGMAMHKKWRKTYFSTPSSMTHEAFAWWIGELWNKRRPKDQRIDFDVSHKALRDGQLCPDRIWRQIVTILDAERGGCDLFDIDELREEYNADDFANLLMCLFVDDGASIFPLELMQRAMVDSWELWTDYKPFALKPFGTRPIWVGYDPALNGDSAGMTVVAPPAVPDGPFRVIEKHQFRGLDFDAQAEAIRKVTQRYNVTYIGIDTTAIGQGVFQLVRQFFPGATAINYSAEVKSRMVLKALDVITKGRLQFDAAWTDLAAAFMAIRKTTTASGKQMTFEAGRNDETGHADLAWATMHALLNEPLEGATSTNRSIMEIS